MTIAVNGRGDQKQRKVTRFEKTLISNAARAHANLAIAKAVIAAQKTGVITLAVANRILTTQSRIAHIGRELTLIFGRGPAAARSQQEQIRKLITQIDQSAQELQSLSQNKLRAKNAGSLQNIPLLLQTLALSLIGARLPAVLGPLLSPIVFRWFCRVKYQTSPEQLIQKRGVGDLRAYDQLANIERVLYKWHHGEMVQEDWNFKTNTHGMLILLGLDYDLGSLTEEQLADCFDKICPCGEPHMPDTLARQLRRIRRNLDVRRAAG